MTAPPKFAPGVKVRITLGMSAGREGVIIEKWGCLFGRGKGAVEQWVVDTFDLVGKRAMRADHLEVIP